MNHTKNPPQKRRIFLHYNVQVGIEKLIPSNEILHYTSS